MARFGEIYSLDTLFVGFIINRYYAIVICIIATIIILIAYKKPEEVYKYFFLVLNYIFSFVCCPIIINELLSLIP